MLIPYPCFFGHPSNTKKDTGWLPGTHLGEPRLPHGVEQRQVRYEALAARGLRSGDAGLVFFLFSDGCLVFARVPNVLDTERETKEA